VISPAGMKLNWQHTVMTEKEMEWIDCQGSLQYKLGAIYTHAWYDGRRWSWQQILLPLLLIKWCAYQS